MNKVINNLTDLKILTPTIYNDERGWFYEAFKISDYSHGLSFIQDNHSYSIHKGTIRGLHLQLAPYEQAKLIRVMKGKIMDVVVDLRVKSDSYLKVSTFELDDIQKKVLYIPKGFAHGFITLMDHTEVYYKVDQVYSKDHEITISYDDNELGIEWGQFEKIYLSEKDKSGLSLQVAIKRLGEDK
jgi:dTDP-4-dehydrorhamnose 3,5-epimerase